MSEDRPDPTAIEDAIAYRFRDRALLAAALTHASFCNEARDPTPDNERLEFLGDAVVSTVIAAAAYDLFPEAREGDLTKLKAAVVSEPSLAERARELHLGDFLRLGHGAATGDHVSDAPSVLADAFEALVGAVFLDGGFEAARTVIRAQLEPALRRAREAGGGLADSKSTLQVTCLRRARCVPRYTVVGHSGPPHDPTFTVHVTLFDGRTFPGTGHSKKEAEQAAAAEALRWINAEMTGTDTTL